MKRTYAIKPIGLVLFGISLTVGTLSAQTPPAAASSEPVLSFTATTANVAGAPDAIRIDILRWSTDAERDRLMSAWNLKGEAGGAAPARAGRGGGRGGAGGGRGAGGRGGPGRGGEAAGAPAETPEGAFAAALQEAPTTGYLWSSEVAGYSLRYAGKVAGPNGGERIILITSGRLGAMNGLWKPSGAEAPAAYDFSVIELRVNAKGEGEGKISLTGKVGPDGATQMIGLENYDALPVVLAKVKKRPPGGHS